MLTWRRLPDAKDDRGWAIERWEADIGPGMGRGRRVVMLTGPTRHLRAWRAIICLRWNDAEVIDQPSLDAAKAAAEGAVQVWLAELGLEAKR